jgi:hypothetical protein
MEEIYGDKTDFIESFRAFTRTGLADEIIARLYGPYRGNAIAACRDYQEIKNKTHGGKRAIETIIARRKP